MGDVIQLPRRGLATPVATVQSLSRTATGRWLSAWDIDDWGRDETLAGAAGWLTGRRWTTSIGGVEVLPASGPAVIVVNTRRFALTQWFVALTLSEATGRPVRFVGRSDVAPFGPLARRLGGLLARTDEIAGALRHGQVIVIGLTASIDQRQAGRCEPGLLSPAVETKAPVFPAAALMSGTSRSARIEVASSIAAPRRRRGPLGEVELARRVEARIAGMLDVFGGARTGTLLDWLPWPAGAG